MVFLIIFINYDPSYRLVLCTDSDKTRRPWATRRWLRGSDDATVLRGAQVESEARNLAWSRSLRKFRKLNDEGVLGSKARVTIDVVECSTSQWTLPSPQAQSRSLSLARSVSDGSLQKLSQNR